MNRRFFSGTFAVGLAPFLFRTAFASTGTQKNQQAARQDDYIFWLDDRERRVACEYSDLILREIDATPLDSRRIKGIYDRASQALRKKSTEASFVSRVMNYREGLGSVKDRVFQGVEGGFKFLPNYPDGHYCIAVYDSVFSGDSVIYTEQLTLSKPSGERWELLDYYQAAKPFYVY